MRNLWSEMRVAVLFCTCMAVLFISPGIVRADGITVTGSITQSTADGTGPAVNNPSLNAIADGDSYTLTLDFAGAVAAAGTFDLTGGTLTLSDPGAPSTEDEFTSISLTVSPDGASDDLSLFACLSTGSGCTVGNSLSMNFAIPSTDLSAVGAPASTISGLSPAMDLLEDDGTTDIQGDVSSYSYVASTPEPMSLVLFSLGLLVIGLTHRRRRSA